MRRIGSTGAGVIGNSVISKYNQENVEIVNGVLTINASLAANYYILMNQNVTSLVLTNWSSSGDTQRIALYIRQDATGYRTITGWPAGTKFAENTPPFLSIMPNAIDCVVIDSFDGGSTFYVTLVGTNYS